MNLLFKRNIGIKFLIVLFKNLIILITNYNLWGHLGYFSYKAFIFLNRTSLFLRMQTDPPKAEQVLIEPKLYVEKSTNGWPIKLKKIY